MLSFQSSKTISPTPGSVGCSRNPQHPWQLSPVYLPLPSQLYKQNIVLLVCCFFFMRTKDELVFLSHPRTHSEGTMPWRDEVQVPSGTTGERAGLQAAEVVARSVTMRHATKQRLQHPPGMKERDLSPAREPLLGHQWSGVRWEITAQTQLYHKTNPAHAFHPLLPHEIQMRPFSSAFQPPTPFHMPSYLPQIPAPTCSQLGAPRF